MQTDARTGNNSHSKSTTADRGGIVKKNKKMTTAEKRRAREKEAKIRKAVDAMGEKMEIEQ